MRLHARVFAILLSPLLALAAFHPAAIVRAAAAESFSDWKSTDGDGRIQYRWSSNGGGVTVQKCSYQLRNTDSSDEKTYASTIYYTDVRGASSSESGPYLDKSYHENSGNITGCTSVSSVITRKQ